MDAGVALAWALPFGVSLAAVGSAFGLGKAVSAAMEAMGRQPEAAGKIQTGMIIGCAFIEALTIYALLTVILLMGKVPAPGVKETAMLIDTVRAWMG
ncbi:MAG: ATP synthase F0 subunit C [Planctomycetes bacterium]|nr:ATP synthase F0 subunit C [Planctomycetota bacterium]